MKNNKGFEMEPKFLKKSFITRSFRKQQFILI